MIDDTTTPFWSEELKKSAIFLNSLYEKNDWNENFLFKCEKAVFLGFFSIRKMRDSKLLGDNVKDMDFIISQYPLKDNVNIENKIITPEKINNFYDIRNNLASTLYLKTICNQFIHSAFFSPLEFNDRSFGFYFTSDDHSKKCLYYIQLIRVVEIFLSAANGKRIKLELDTNNGIKIKDFNKYID
jgi:hypothetical protein